jgi:hypothetical protein
VLDAFVHSLQCLLTLLDSPLNKAGLLQVFIHTTKGVLIEINPHVRIPRTFKRFSGLMGACNLPPLECTRAYPSLSPTAPQTVYSRRERPRKIAKGHQGEPIPLSDTFGFLSFQQNPVTDHLPPDTIKLSQ